jgi:aspartyl-tRNA(Asn)/glutamyl-tRNA(Gln) amidotransferase subunit C
MTPVTEAREQARALQVLSPDTQRRGCYDFPSMAHSKITPEQVQHVALLARLSLAPDEEDRIRANMDEILGYIDKLNELKTDGVEPTAQVGDAGTPTRDDVVTNHPDPAAMLANAPDRERGYFKVPKIIE